MNAEPAPQLCLVTPPAPEAARVAPRLAALLEAAPLPVACVRLATAGMDEAAIRAAAAWLRPLCHGHDVALVIEDHFRLVAPLGLDGAHLLAPRFLREARREIGAGQILGAFCGSSRHAAMTAAEAGADYVALGPFAMQGALGPGRLAERDFAAWWAEVVEIPLVVEGLDAESFAALSPLADFLTLEARQWFDPAELDRLTGARA